MNNLSQRETVVYCNIVIVVILGACVFYVDAFLLE